MAATAASRTETVPQSGETTPTRTTKVRVLRLLHTRLRTLRLAALLTTAFAGLAGSLGATRASSTGFALGVPVAPSLSVEETRFLGGDLEHTHLVKGLDYALLHKVRQTARLEEAGERAEEARPSSDHAAAAPTVHTSLGRAIHAFVTGVRCSVCSSSTTVLMSPAGQHRPASAAVERFAQGRVAFLFDLEVREQALPAVLQGT